ncbi:MAG: FAD:protein FMN transferase [Halioglobus sp.]|nr:FAD:protein FMN transferase [Halioglobus sp.]
MQSLEHSFKAMGGPCRFRLEVPVGFEAQAALEAAEQEVRRLEAKYSRYLDDSLTSCINDAAGTGEAVAIDTETAALLNYADTAWRESDGLFDLTSGVLRRAWDFRSGTPPAAEAVAELLPLVGWDKVRWDKTSVSLPVAGMELDFGGCVKEYAADSAAMALRRAGVQVALVDLAGDLAAVGVPTGKQGWPVGIRRPEQSGGALAYLLLPEGALASSGDYERCIEVEGERYGHILHPATGWPVRGLVAVSVLAPQCLVAGSSATIAMLKPVDEALTWLEQLGLPWMAVDASLNVHGTVAPS